MSNSFPKSERLHSRYLIDRLFEPGKCKSLTAYPIRMVYRINDTEADSDDSIKTGNALLISVPKKHFHHAVDRNRIKRQMREAYRTNKELIRLPEGKSVHMALIWLSNTHLPSLEVTEKVKNLMHRLSERQ